MVGEGPLLLHSPWGEEHTVGEGVLNRESQIGPTSRSIVGCSPMKPTPSSAPEERTFAAQVGSLDVEVVVSIKGRRSRIGTPQEFSAGSIQRIRHVRGSRFGSRFSSPSNHSRTTPVTLRPISRCGPKGTWGAVGLKARRQPALKPPGCVEDFWSRPVWATVESGCPQPVEGYRGSRILAGEGRAHDPRPGTSRAGWPSRLLH